EVVGFTPHAGFMSYDDFANNSQTRPTVGFTVEADALKLLDFGPESKGWFIGPTGGFFFTPLAGSRGNYFDFPANIKVAYLLFDNVRIGGHTGGTFTFRSTSNSMDFGGDPTNFNNQLNFYFNIGADAEVEVAEGIAILARPDIMFTPGSNVFTGTI